MTPVRRRWLHLVQTLLLAVLMPLWRRMGILQFKNLLAVAVVVVLTVPALQVLPVLVPPPLGAAPAGEVVDVDLVELAPNVVEGHQATAFMSATPSPSPC